MQEINRSRHDHRRYQGKQQSSKVLLVCVYDTVALEVTNQLIYQTFSKFGSILRVLIFQKGQVTKLFVQYTQVKFAQLAKSTLDGTKLLGVIGKMNIYYSNFSNVDLKNQTSEGQDYTMRQEMNNQYVRRFDQMSKSFQNEQHKFLDDEFILQSPFHSQFPARSKTDNPQRLQDQIHKLYVTPNYQNHPHSQAMVNNEQVADRTINKSIDNLLLTPPLSFQDKNSKNKQFSHSPSQKIHPAIRFKEAEPVRSSVLKFSLTKEISIRCIYNLFSNFGNISFISKKKNKSAYIKFRSLQFAAIARTYLNEKNLMGNLLLLRYPESVEEAFPKQPQYCQCVFYDQTSDRFTPHRSLTINSPSHTLHISSIKKDICKQHVLYDIFSQFGKVQAVKILCYSNEKNMALVNYYSMEDSFQAIACLHNQIFSGRKMQISFTKSRI